MDIFSLCSLIVLITASLAQVDLFGENSNLVWGAILEDDLSSPSLEQTSNPDFKINGLKVVPLETLKTTTEFPSTRQQPPIEASKCPNASKIAPCACGAKTTSYTSHNRNIKRRLEIRCASSRVNQTVFENTFRELRQVNEIPQGRDISIHTFELSYTQMTQLNLAPLYGSHMEFLILEKNHNLSKWRNSGNPEDHGSIHADRFYLLFCQRMSRDEFPDALLYFSAQMTHFSLSFLDLSNERSWSRSRPTEAGGEIFPALSGFKNLKSLSLGACNISGRLNSLHFKGLPSLEFISLSGNKIDEVGEGVFPPNVSTIYLSSNKLNETSIHPNSGIAKIGRQTDFYLLLNQFTTLPAPIFETFLDAHPKNRLYLQVNPLICDQKLSWLKSRKEEFQSPKELQARVLGADCSNDSGDTAFTSKLIP